MNMRNCSLRDFCSDADATICCCCCCCWDEEGGPVEFGGGYRPLGCGLGCDDDDDGGPPPPPTPTGPGPELSCTWDGTPLLDTRLLLLLLCWL